VENLICANNEADDKFRFDRQECRFHGYFHIILRQSRYGCRLAVLAPGRFTRMDKELFPDRLIGDSLSHVNWSQIIFLPVSGSGGGPGSRFQCH